LLTQVPLNKSSLKYFDFKDFQDYIEEKVGQEIDIESSRDTVTKLEKDDKRIVFHPHRKGV
jgi:benzoyl-CoA reductase/2-hydroxyglutaryl-CoA dehydratase subunit BcrC/BadD/HgdB